MHIWLHYNEKRQIEQTKENSEVTVLAGNRDRSRVFVEHCTTHRTLADGTQEFRFYLDNKCVKRATLKPKGCLETLPIDC